MAKIMVVDDDFTIGDLFKRILEREGYRVIVARTGEDCLGVVKREGIESIQFVFLDLKMPGMGGESVLGELRKLNNTLPVAIITGHGDFYKWDNLYQGDIAAYITKPLNFEYIKALVRNIVG